MTSPNTSRTLRTMRAGTLAAIVSLYRANQSLAVGTVIQHASRVDIIEIVQIASTSGALTSTANPRIATGIDGQMIVLQGTSASNTYTIPDGNGVKWASSSSGLVRPNAPATTSPPP